MRALLPIGRLKTVGMVPAQHCGEHKDPNLERRLTLFADRTMQWVLVQGPENLIVLTDEVDPYIAKGIALSPETARGLASLLTEAANEIDRANARKA